MTPHACQFPHHHPGPRHEQDPYRHQRLWRAVAAAAHRGRLAANLPIGAGMKIRDLPTRDWTVVLRQQPVRMVDGHPDGGYTRMFEFSFCCDCGDRPGLDYREVPSRLRQIRGPYPIAVGVEASRRSRHGSTCRTCSVHSNNPARTRSPGHRQAVEPGPAGQRSRDRRMRAHWPWPARLSPRNWAPGTTPGSSPPSP